MTVIEQIGDLGYFAHTNNVKNRKRIVLKKDAACNNNMNVKNVEMKKQQPRSSTGSMQSVIKVLIYVTISIIIHSQVIFVTCAGSSAVLGIDISDSRKAHDEESITNGVSVSGGGSSSSSNPGLYFDKIGSLEMSIAAVFNKVAYGTTTKRSIPDNVFVPNLTTVPTPQLTTFRYCLCIAIYSIITYNFSNWVVIKLEVHPSDLMQIVPNQKNLPYICFETIV